MNLPIANLKFPVSIIPERPMSDDELFDFCQANELLCVERDAKGVLRVMSPAGSGSGGMNAEITAQLRNWAKVDGRGISFDSSTGWTLPDGSMLNPDASWVRRERWLALTERERERFAPLCPEFVVELRSPSDRLAPLQAKMLDWLANGAEVGWLIDPRERTVTIFRTGESPEELVDPSTAQGSGVIAGFELVMGEVWG